VNLILNREIAHPFVPTKENPSFLSEKKKKHQDASFTGKMYAKENPVYKAHVPKTTKQNPNNSKKKPAKRNLTTSFTTKPHHRPPSSE
jgi:hypothetical protein